MKPLREYFTAGRQGAVNALDWLKAAESLREQREGYLKEQAAIGADKLETYTDEEIISYVSDGYTEMKARIADFTATLTEKERSDWSNAIRNYSPRSAFRHIVLGVPSIPQDCIDSYEIPSKLAFEGFYKRGLEGGSLVLPMILIEDYRDPRMALYMSYRLGIDLGVPPVEPKHSKFAEDIYSVETDLQNPFVRPKIRVDDVMEEHASDERMERVRRLRRGGNLISLIKAAFLTRQKLATAEERTTLFHAPLQRISVLPPVAMQALYDAIPKEPLEISPEDR